MKSPKVLLIFTRESIEENKAKPDELISLIAAEGGVEASWACTDELVFTIQTSSAQVTVGVNGPDLRSFDVIYFRRFQADPGVAYGAALYADYMGVRIIDTEILHQHGSVSKLTQYVRLALAGYPVPATFYAHSSHLEHVITDGGLPFKYPVVIKAVAGTRGADNHLAHTKAEALRIVAGLSKTQVVVQEFIANVGDYRVWVVGDQLGPVFYRQRADAATHLNNTSKGASLQAVPADHLPSHIVAMACRAAASFERSVAGVDIVENQDAPGDYRIFEVNRAPQIEGTSFADQKIHALVDYFIHLAKHPKPARRHIVGRSERIQFPELGTQHKLHARVDTGATTSALWASDVIEHNGELRFKLLGQGHPDYTGKELVLTNYSTKVVASSVGIPQRRYLIKTLVRLKGRTIRASFTLADRSKQVYPVLIGRNILRGKFIVDVRTGQSLYKQEKQREAELDAEY